MSDDTDFSLARLMAVGFSALEAEELLVVLGNAALISFPFVTVAADYQMESDDSRVAMNASGGVRNVYLPNIVAVINRQFKVYRAIADTSGNTISIRRSLGDGVNPGGLVAQISFPNDPLGVPQSYDFENDGANWYAS